MTSDLDSMGHGFSGLRGHMGSLPEHSGGSPATMAVATAPHAQASPLAAGASPAGDGPARDEAGRPARLAP